MKDFSVGPFVMFSSLWENRSLIRQLTKREILGRYRGSVMGLLWSFINPFFMLAVYTFVFSVVFKARWNVESNSKTEFALVLFIGLIFFNLFAECINRAPSLIQSNVSFVKKVVFPLEILPFVTLLSALFHGAVSLGVWLLTYVIFFGVPHPTIFFLVLILLPFMLFVMGVSWFLTSLGVYLRDVSQVITIVTTVLMFLSPIFYPVSALPEKLRFVLNLNPLTHVIGQAREVMFWGHLPDFWLLSISSVASLVFAWLGFVWFQKTRKGFADVL